MKGHTHENWDPQLWKKNIQAKLNNLSFPVKFLFTTV